MKSQFSIWEISFPVAFVIIFAIGAVTSIYMIDGRYHFRLNANSKGVSITTDIDKFNANLEQKKNNKQEVKLAK